MTGNIHGYIVIVVMITAGEGLQMYQKNVKQLQHMMLMPSCLAQCRYLYVC